MNIPLQIFRCEQLTISDENSWRLLLLMSLWRAYQSGFDHKFVSSVTSKSSAYLNGFSIGNIWEIFKPFYLLSAWAHRSAFFLNVSGVWRASRQCKNFCSALFITKVIQGKRPVYKVNANIL